MVCGCVEAVAQHFPARATQKVEDEQKNSEEEDEVVIGGWDGAIEDMNITDIKEIQKKK